MSIIRKNVTIISVFTAMVLSQNTAFAQTLYLAEAPLVTQSVANQTIATQAVISQSLNTPNISKTQTSQFIESKDIDAQVIDVNTHFITPASKPKWPNQTADETRWLLSPQFNETQAAKSPRDYSKDFTGLRTSILADNNTKIGTATQYIDAGDRPLVKASASPQDVYSKTDDNFLLRAKVGF